MRTDRVNPNSSLVKSIVDANVTNDKDLKPIATVFTASYFELVILALLIATILIGNSLVCLAFKAVSRRLKTITNSFVISLAMSDILVGAFSLPLWVTFRMGYFLENSVPYFLYLGLDIVCGSASIMNLTIISIERMYAVRFPAKHRNISHKRGVIIVGVILVWGLSIILASLSTLKFMNIWPSYTYLVVVIAFILPTVLIITSYILIFMTMKTRQEQHWRFKQEMRLAVMIGIVIVLFLICWFPFFLLNILLHHACPCSNNHYLYPLIPIVKYMHYANSLMNPIIYAYRYPDYRHAFKKLLFKCACCKEQVVDRQRTASIRSTLSSTVLHNHHEEQSRDREILRHSSQLSSRLPVADIRDRRLSDEKYLLCPSYKPSRDNSGVWQTTSV